MSNHRKTSNIIQFVDTSVDTKHFENNNFSKRNSIKPYHLAVEGLKPKSKSIIYWFEGITGFGIRVSSSGFMTWIIQYRLNGKSKRMAIGHYPNISLSEARKIYGELRLNIDLGADPLEERRNQEKRKKEDIRVLELIELYTLDSKKMGKKSADQERGIFLNGLSDKILNKRISQVKPREIAEAVGVKVKNGTPVAAKQLLKYTKRLFNYGAGLLLLEQNNNPCIGIKLNLPKKKRQRHLNPKEIYLLWHNLEKFPVSPVLRLALKFMLCTAARSVEVRNMKWCDIDLANNKWTMPTSKNGRMHRVHLGNLGVDLINQARLYTSNCEWVFGYSKHNGRGQIINNKLEPFKVWTLSQVFRRHFEKLNITNPFYPHDLRRTAATMITGLLGRRDYATMVLNHTTSDVTGIYDLYTYDNEKKLALEALNKALRLIIISPNVESVPSFDEIRSKIIRPNQHINLHREDLEESNFQGPPTKFSSPVSYTLSYAHDELKKLT